MQVLHDEVRVREVCHQRNRIVGTRIVVAFGAASNVARRVRIGVAVAKAGKHSHVNYNEHNMLFVALPSLKHGVGDTVVGDIILLKKEKD
jgi:hypothetical protein